MVVIVKRYPMDDVPVKVVRTMKGALRWVQKQGWKEGDRATEEDQNIAGCDIGCDLISVYGYETDLRGKVFRSVPLL
jgi:hypothetical protein